MPSSDADESRRAAKPQNSAGALPPTEQENLPCPRCDSTNTKFCYYNNYNYSQPRHFCKSCRRYWTHGGTLRDIPVGGGSRKNPKRSRTNHHHHHASAATSASSSSTVTSAPIQDHHHPALSAMVPVVATFGIAGGGVDHGEVKQNVNVCGSFTSLLSNNATNTAQGSGFGLGLEDMVFGLGRAGWAYPGMVDGTNVGGGGAAASGSWQLEGGECGFVGGDCFSWPGLAISREGAVMGDGLDFRFRVTNWHGLRTGTWECHHL